MCSDYPSDNADPHSHFQLFHFKLVSSNLDELLASDCVIDFSFLPFRRMFGSCGDM